MKTKKILSALILSASIFSFAQISPSYASNISFTDVPPNFWGYQNIQWAINNQVIDGYPDGTFKPNQNVNQNEFLAMLIRAYQPKDFSVAAYTNKDWALPYVDYSKKMGWNIAMTASTVDLDSSYYRPVAAPPITRGFVARIIANATGKNYSEDDSIQYLLDTGLSDGKTGKSVVGFSKDDTLTRTEALTFIQRLKSVDSNLKSSPTAIENYKSTTQSINEVVNLTSNTQMYQSPSTTSKVLGTLAPQYVNAISQSGHWYQIQSDWLGKAWIYVDDLAQVIIVENVDQKLNLTAETKLYQAPTTYSQNLGSLATQTVTAFEKVGNWYHMHTTWVGDAWLYVDNSAKDEISPDNATFTNLQDPAEPRIFIKSLTIAPDNRGVYRASGMISSLSPGLVNSQVSCQLELMDKNGIRLSAAAVGGTINGTSGGLTSLGIYVRPGDVASVKVKTTIIPIQ